MAALTSSPLASLALTFYLRTPFYPTLSTSGNLSSSLLPAASMRVTASVLRSPAARSLFTIATPAAARLRREQPRGTGLAPRNSSITTLRGLRLCIFRCGARRHEHADNVGAGLRRSANRIRRRVEEIPTSDYRQP